jgi:hypothetical protein
MEHVGRMKLAADGSGSCVGTSTLGGSYVRVVKVFDLLCEGTVMCVSVQYLLCECVRGLFNFHTNSARYGVRAAWRMGVPTCALRWAPYIATVTSNRGLLGRMHWMYGFILIRVAIERNTRGYPSISACCELGAYSSSLRDGRRTCRTEGNRTKVLPHASLSSTGARIEAVHSVRHDLPTLHAVAR